jgi:ABC-type transport system involved in multi-copper enzyme maturation permease subunit
MPALLVKELTEQANRRRTYWLRGAVAAVLFLSFLMVQREVQAYGNTDGGMGLLGRGAAIFDSLVYGCLWSLIALVPGMTAAALTEEKESGTLPLLMLSRIGLRGIVLQKWLARVITGGSLLLPALPLATVAYACGGLDPTLLWFGLALVAVTLMWTAAIGLAASAWCRSTMGAFILAYVLVGGMCLLALAGDFRNSTTWLCPPGLFTEVQTTFSNYRQYGRQYGFITQPHAAYESLFPLGVCALSSLGFALLVLRRRAEVHGRPWILRLFSWLDRAAVAVDARWFKRTTRADLPLSRPVQWREVQGRSLANWRYLVRWSLPLLILVLLGMIAGGNHMRQTAGVMTCLVMVATILVITVKAAGAFSGERADQTLAVLLTTPLRPRDIVRDKAAGLRRLHLSCLVILGVVVALRVLFDDHLLPDLARTNSWHRQWIGPLTVAATLLIPAITGWTAMIVGLTIHRRAWAVMMALGTVLFIGLGLPLLCAIIGKMAFNEIEDSVVVTLLGASPILLPAMNETEGIQWHDEKSGRNAVILWCLLQPLHYLALRWYCLRNADRWLRRGA